MYVIDTKIVSLFDPRRRQGAEATIAWLRQNDALIFLSAVTLMEIEAGFLKLAREGKAKRASQIAALRDGLLSDFADRILPVDAMVAIAVARLAERARPDVVERLDLMIAATADVHRFTVVTRNTKHFLPTGVPVLDPTNI